MAKPDDDGHRGGLERPEGGEGADEAAGAVVDGVEAVLHDGLDGPDEGAGGEGLGAEVGVAWGGLG